jgi:hypothetical protein
MIWDAGITTKEFVWDFDEFHHGHFLRDAPHPSQMNQTTSK